MKIGLYQEYLLKAYELTNKTFSLVPTETINNLKYSEEFNYIGKFDGEMVKYDFMYYTDDSYMQDWIEENADFLTEKLDMVVIKFEVFGCVFGFKKLVNNVYEEYFIRFWKEYYNKLEKEQKEIEDNLIKIQLEDKEYHIESEDIDFLLEDGCLYSKSIVVKDFDFKNKEIHLEKGLNYLSALLDKDIEPYFIEYGINLDNDWIITQKKY